jgi:cell division septation protein DedD
MLDEDDQKLRRPERELTLGAGTLLGMFLALVLLCGGFFGFGYRLGSRSVKTVPVAGSSGSGESQPGSDPFNSFKPAAGSPAEANQAGAEGSEPGPGGLSPSATPAGSAGSPAAGPLTAANPAATAPGNTSTSASGSSSPSAVTAPEAPVAAGQFIVQVAAVSHQEDAELLVSALRAKGYPVSAHTVPQDKFFHIQVGPFPSLQDANAAKQRLLADGYQPIIK